MREKAKMPEADSIGLNLTIGPPGTARFDHDDGEAEAIMRPDRLSDVTGGAGALIASEAPIIVEARGAAGAFHLELLPAAAEALGMALLWHAARVEP